MYKNYSRDSRKLKDWGPLRICCNPTRICSEVDYYFYANRQTVQKLP